MQQGPLEKKNKKLLKDIAYEKIKEKILTGEETFMSENSLVEELKMSRTPIKEALYRLHHEGFVKIISNQGILIHDLSVKEMNDLIDMRIAIETFSLKQAVHQMTSDDFSNLRQNINRQKEALANNDYARFLEEDASFHLYLLEIVGNDIFIQMYKNARERQFSARAGRYLKNRPEVIASRIEEHEQILRFLELKDICAAVQELENHVTGGKLNHLYLKNDYRR